MEHHIWCNFFMNKVEGCKMCIRLHKEYPVEDKSASELLKKYFPDIVGYYHKAEKLRANRSKKMKDRDDDIACLIYLIYIVAFNVVVWL